MHRLRWSSAVLAALGLWLAQTHARGEEPAAIPEVEAAASADAPPTAAEAAEAVPAAAAPLSPELQALGAEVTAALDAYYRQPLNTRDHTPWQVLHWAIAYGVDAEIPINGPLGPPASAIGWLCGNRPCKGQQFLRLTPAGLHLPLATGLQGHNGQFLSMLAQSRVPQDYPLEVSGRKLTVADLVRHEQLSCKTGSELTFQLIGLCHYLPSDAAWTSASGEEWTLPRLIEEEMRAPILHRAACGGTHRLVGLSYAVNRRRHRNEPVDGAWAQARDFTAKYEARAFELQNLDGSFSTNWFVGPAAGGDANRRLNTSGHTLEWLMFQLSDERLRAPETMRAVRFVCRTLMSGDSGDWNAGAMGHSLHALAMYEQRVYGARPGQRREARAARTAATAAE